MNIQKILTDAAKKAVNKIKKIPFHKKKLKSIKEKPVSLDPPETDNDWWKY